MAKIQIKELKAPATGSMSWTGKFNRTIVWTPTETISEQWLDNGWRSNIKTLKDGTRKLSQTVAGEYNKVLSMGQAIIHNSGCVLETAE